MTEASILSDTDLEHLLAHLREDMIGGRALLPGPFGDRMITYADFTASGRSLHCIEDYLRRTVLVEYANTHTEDSVTGLRTTERCHEVAAMVKRSVGADAERDVVLWCGTGSTGSIKRFQEILGLAIPPGCDVEACAVRGRPTVVVGPYEHHSNEITWRETTARVQQCPLDAEGLIDLNALDRLCAEAKPEEGRLIGSFSAASNVTGVLTDVHAIARILHRHGGIACFDFAAAAPYVHIDMHPDGDPDASLDAIFLSPHKMLGGPDTPGILVFRRDLYDLAVPTTSGGGTVVYVSPLGHVYMDDIEAREEAGTPGIVQKLRAGLAFGLKDKLGARGIEAREHRWLELAIERFKQEPALEILGPETPNRLPIISFNVRLSDTGGPGGRPVYLHHRFITALLNDLFGIQSRAGCSCAGPYGHRLLGIGAEDSERYRCVIVDGYEGLKPGWVRVGFHFVMDEDECRFLLDAIAFVAKYGNRFRPLYRFDVHTGLWVHREAPLAGRPLVSIDAMLDGVPDPRSEPNPKTAYRQYLEEAERLAADLPDPDLHREQPDDLAPNLADLVFFAW